MAAKKLALALCALGFLQTSFAGFDRLWFFSKEANTEASDNWDNLSEEERKTLIKRYQSIKELPEEQSQALQQRMTWFTQLPEPEKQKMRTVWQAMNYQERNQLRQRMQKATPEERNLIRDEYIKKYTAKLMPQ